MITEDYIDYSIAKLLKEKGFDEEIETLITPTGKIYFLDENSVEKIPHKTIRNTQINTYSNDVSCPTLQMAMKWLREVHDVIIMIDYGTDGFTEPDKRYGFSVFARPHYIVSPKTYSTYEEASEDAILFCLKKII